MNDARQHGDTAMDKPAIRDAYDALDRAVSAVTSSAPHAPDTRWGEELRERINALLDAEDHLLRALEREGVWRDE